MSAQPKMFLKRASSSVKANPKRRRAAPDHRGRRSVIEPLPRDEHQRFSLLLGERSQSRGDLIAALDDLGRIPAVARGFAREAFIPVRAASRGAAAVRDDPQGDTVKPGQRCVRDGVSTAPGDGERLGRNVFGLRATPHSANRERQDLQVVRVEGGVKSRSPVAGAPTIGAGAAGHLRAKCPLLFRSYLPASACNEMVSAIPSPLSRRVRARCAYASSRGEKGQRWQ